MYSYLQNSFLELLKLSDVDCLVILLLVF